MGALIIGGLQFLMLIAALLNIFWCCGKSNKVQDDDDDYYDDVYYLKKCKSTHNKISEKKLYFVSSSISIRNG